MDSVFQGLTDQQIASAETALVQFGAAITDVQAIPENPQPVPGTSMTSYVTETLVVTSDGSITQDQIAVAVTNATGIYASGGIGPSGTGTGPSSPGGFGTLDLGAFLNSIGNAIKNALKFPGLDLSWLWWVVLALIAIFFIAVFVPSFGRGLGEGVAARA